MCMCVFVCVCVYIYIFRKRLIAVRTLCHDSRSFYAILSYTVVHKKRNNFSYWIRQKQLQLGKTGQILLYTDNFTRLGEKYVLPLSAILTWYVFIVQHIFWKYSK